MDIGPWHGKSLSLQVDELAQDSQALRSVTLSDEIPSTASLYSEPLRGQIHFSPRRGWNNDPNGLVYFNGEYHLFFQHNPYGWRWENMHWGHAVSPDLVHWHELGDVLLPDAMGPMFSGSAVVDWHNTSGLGKPGKPPLVLFYTAAGDPTVQCLAYSLNGRDFTKYAHNPIIPQVTPGNRDPKVMWHEPTKRWVMVLYVEVKGVHTIQFFTSPNLRDWTFQSQTDGFYECPDLFELAVDGNAANRKWVLMAASGEYRVGSFDGVSFHAETPMIPLSRGKGFYAPQTFSDIPASDGRRIQIGWFQTETPGMPFNQSMTLPTELTLVSTDDGPRLSALPVRELASLRSLGDLRENVTIRPGDGSPQADVAAELVEFEAEFEPGEATKVLIEVRGATIEFDLSAHEISVNGHRTPIRPGPQHVRVFVDRIGLEVFADDGLTYIPMPFLPSAANLGVAVKVEGGEVKFSRLGLYELKSAWQKPGKHPAGG
jgi:sucrose-6-phosphate hydrolase SacC (GH32 family)